MSPQNYRVMYLLEEGDALAVFLDSTGDCRPGMLMTYRRIGEHGEADLSYLRQLPLATADEYRALHTYLVRRYSDPTQGTAYRLVVDTEMDPEELVG